MCEAPAGFPRQTGTGWAAGPTHTKPARRKAAAGARPCPRTSEGGTHQGRAVAAERGQKKEATVSRRDRPPGSCPHIPQAPTAASRGTSSPLCGPCGHTSAWGRRARALECGDWLPAAPERQAGLPYLGRQLRDPTGHIVKKPPLFHLRGLEQRRQPSGRKPPWPVRQASASRTDPRRQLCASPSPRERRGAADPSPGHCSAASSAGEGTPS